MLVAGKTDHLGTHAHTGHLGASMSSVRIPGSLRRPIGKPASAGSVKKDASVTTLVTAAFLLAGSIYLMLDMTVPFSGPIKISPAPLLRAQEQMRR